MIEEAAGTRLYESKKESAQRTIEKKDAKLREIDSVMYFSCLDIIIRVTRAHHSQRPENGIVAVAGLPYSTAFCNAVRYEDKSVMHTVTTVLKQHTV